MRLVSYSAVFIAHAVVGIFALAPLAQAQSVDVAADTTISADVIGDPGANGADDAVGDPGGNGINWVASGVDVFMDPFLTILAGKGGNGGADAANDGGNNGGTGGSGLVIGDTGSAQGASQGIIGGDGGSGSAGGTGGASDTAGGDGGSGGFGFQTSGDGVVVNFQTSSIFGGNGGDGGDAGDAPGDATDAASGGHGGIAGHGIYLGVGTGTVLNVLGTSEIRGGDGGDGGASLANATNAGGWNGGAGIYDIGTNSTISVSATSFVGGGDGGVAGTGGTGGIAGNDGSGIVLAGTGASLINYGTIVGSENNGPAALRIDGNTTVVNNAGTIGAAADHAGIGVLLTNAKTLGTLHNQAGGLIQSTGISNTVALLSGTTVTSFINEGSIVNSEGGSAVYLGGTVTSFSNSGTIQGGGNAALYIDSALTPDTITNSGGLITSTTAAVQIWTDLGAAAVTFDGGKITSTGAAPAIAVLESQTGAIGLANVTIGKGILFLHDNEDLDVRASALNGEIAFAGGANLLNFEGAGTSTIDAVVISTGTLTVNAGNGASVIVNQDQDEGDFGIDLMEIDATSDLTLNALMVVNETLLNYGRLTIAAADAALGVKALSGEGTYVFGIEDAGPAPIFGYSAASTMDFTGASFEIVLVNPATLFSSGTNLLLADISNTDNAILGITNGTQIVDNSALLDFFLYRGDAIGEFETELFAQVQLLLLADIAGHGDDPNAITLGGALDTIGLDGDDDIDDLMQKLAGLPTDADINEVLDSLLPETDGVAYDIATDAGDQALDVASRRLDTLRGMNVATREYKLASAAPTGPGSAGSSASYFWAQAFGRAIDQSKHDFNDGYDAGTYGFALGADTAFSGGKAQLGLAFSYASTDADGNGINRTNTSVDSYQLTLYGDRAFADGIYAKGLLAVGWHQNDIVRHDVGGIVANNATGEYDASQLSARAELGRAFAAGRRLTLIPHLTLSYTSYDPDGYTESGIGGLGLTVDADSLTSFRLGAGLLARWDFALDDGGRLQPELRLSYRNDLTRERFETGSEFLGAPDVAFRTQGVEPSADILNLGLGALLATAGGIDLRASYDLELKEDYTAHGGYIRASLPF